MELSLTMKIYAVFSDIVTKEIDYIANGLLKD